MFDKLCSSLNNTIVNNSDTKIVPDSENYNFQSNNMRLNELSINQSAIIMEN